MEPITEIDARYSSEGAVATPWEQTRELLERAETYWLSTVRPDGRPHVTTLIALWHEGAMYFTTGPEERKALNLEANRNVALTTGVSSMSGGLDVVVEGVAERATDPATLKSLSEAYVAKYGSDWAFQVGEGGFLHEGGGLALVFQVAPRVVLSFRKGDFAQTRYRF
ncbi:pyridoxamine 5'-phosphate oxidase family protein [Nonomuraea sediminis]|uniref:pyridoxamine 5'-phosphate oxidase family protein n=1 Tax=Nonomuraea sediminis TaxID=2835864 RepID=UPI001BDBE522|nr:pyridoxamine 5'-phosphate oxidase family protein [Nonomuraea sediminis]